MAHDVGDRLLPVPPLPAPPSVGAMRSDCPRGLASTGSLVQPVIGAAGRRASSLAPTVAALQRTAGNAAVAQMVAGQQRSVQRIPDKSEDRTHDLKKKYGDDQVRFIQYELSGSGNDRWDAADAQRGQWPKWKRGGAGNDPARWQRPSAGGGVTRTFAGPGGPSTPYAWDLNPMGSRDTGTNSIDNVVRKATELVKVDVRNLRASYKGRILLLIRSHSRGAVASSLLVSNLLKTKFEGIVDIELAAHDPVPGPNQQGQKKALDLLAPDSELYQPASYREVDPWDVSPFTPSPGFEKVPARINAPDRPTDQALPSRDGGPTSQGMNLPTLTESTVVYAVASGYTAGFTPQALFGAKRLIISQQVHEAGSQTGFSFTGEDGVAKVYYGSSLNSLPPGLYIGRTQTTPGRFWGVNRVDNSTSRRPEPIERLDTADGLRARLQEIYKHYSGLLIKGGEVDVQDRWHNIEMASADTIELLRRATVQAIPAAAGAH